MSESTSIQRRSTERLFWKLSAILFFSVLWIMCTKSSPDNTQSPVKKAADTVKIIQNPITTDTSIANRTVQQMWNDFYAAKDSVDSALSRSDFLMVRSFLKKAAFHALEVSRDDIAAWQLNNIGYYSIEEFKRKTDYNLRMRNIENMRRGPEKIVYIKKTKEIFKDHLLILLDATSFLEEAYELDKDFNDNDRTTKIYSNLTYIDWVRNFTNAE